jgi:hypothetical protein
MTTTHEAGPLVVFGQAYSSGAPEYNPDRGTSLFWAGAGLLDQRVDTYWQYRPGMQSYQGWLGAGDVFSLSFVPTTLASASIAALQAPTNGSVLTLVTASSAGGTVISAAVVNATTGVSVGGLLLLDALTASATGSITGNVFYAASVANGTFTVGSVLSGTGVTTNTTIIGMAGHGGSTGGGTTGTYIVTPAQTVSAQVTVTGIAGINGVPLVPGSLDVVSPLAGSALGIPGSKLYNPVAMLARNVRITTSSGDSAVYTVRGYDIYGYSMSEAITANGATTVSGKKAFKYVASVTPVGTVGALTSIGTGDVFGFPLASLQFGDVNINWSAALIVASTGYTAGDWSVATTTTGDTRGTYAVQSASDGSKRLVVYQFPMPTNAVSQNGTFGVTQT